MVLKTGAPHLRSRPPREWLQDFMRAEIDCVAVTGHNSGSWIDELKTAYRKLEAEAPPDFRPLHLFPGVEIHANGGVHVLAILGPQKSRSDIDCLLGAVGLAGSASAPLGGCSSQSVVQVVEAIGLSGGLAIPAHVDGHSGLFKVCRGETLGGVFACNSIVAIEILDPAFPKPAVSGKPCPSWSEVLGSDSHHPRGNDGQRYPGSHYTWVKMGTPSLEGLRLALLDGAPLSIRRSDVAGEDPNDHPRLVIESVEIANAGYTGRGPQPLAARFSPWLTTSIGSRGTGKSTVLEMMRVAMRRTDELPADLREEFDRFASVLASRSERGALTPETRVTLTLRKDGARFRVNWSQAEAVSAIEEADVDGGWKQSPGDVRGRFPVRILSQKQVFSLSNDPGALLRLVDEAPSVNRADWDARWQELETRFLRLRSQARELGAQLGERSRFEGELADARRQLAVFEEGGHRELLVSYQRLGRQRRVLDDRNTELERAAESIRTTASEIEPSDVRAEDFDAGAPAEAEAREEGTGCLQEPGVREAICRVMEGRREAFEARYKRLLEEMDRVR